MNVLANDNELLKYIETWNKIEALFRKKGFCSKPVYNNEYIKTKISSYNEIFHDLKKLINDEYCGHSILLLESICETENEYYPQIFLHNFFEKLDDSNVNSLFKELIQIADWSNDESSDESFFS